MSSRPITHAEALRLSRAVQRQVVGLRPVLIECAPGTATFERPTYDARLRALFIPRAPIELPELEAALSVAFGQGFKGRRTIHRLLRTEAVAQVAATAQ